MRKTALLCVLTGCAWFAASVGAKDDAQPGYALARLRYYVGKQTEFILRTPEALRAVLDWLAQVEKGPESEHARNGACDRDAELEFYAAADAAKPARVVELFTGCKHVLKREVAAAQFAALRKIVEERGERLLVVTERDNGKTLDAAVRQLIEVQLKGDRPGTGWEASSVEGGAVQRDGAQPGEVNASPTLVFTPKPGAADKAIGTYVFCYKAVKAGQSKLRVVYVSPGGPFPMRRTATQLVKEFAVVVKVAGTVRE